MKKKNGFISISVVYTFFFVFLMMLLFIISRYTDNRTLLKVIKKDIKDNLSNSYKSEFSFGYTGSPIEFEIPLSGIYKIELWGAQGGNIDTYLGGKGAYTSGQIQLIKGERIYIYVGNVSTTPNVASFNGGGADTDNFGAAGGGATDIRLIGGAWNDFNSLKSRIMVAAGGGGANNRNRSGTGTFYFGAGNGGYAGGLNGGNGESLSTSHRHPTTGQIYGWQYGVGGFQNTGGYAIGNDITQIRDITVLGQFGYASNNQSGGGGGYYGGGSNIHGGAGGGSSFISGYPGCNAISNASTLGNIILTGQPIHYSTKVFQNAVMIAGNGLMPNPNGGEEIGHSGNGYAKITLINTI